MPENDADYQDQLVTDFNPNRNGDEDDALATASQSVLNTNAERGTSTSETVTGAGTLGAGENDAPSGSSG